MFTSLKEKENPELSRDKVTFGMLHFSLGYLTFKEGHWQYTEVLLEIHSMEYHCVTENKAVVIKQIEKYEIANMVSF